MIFRGFKGFNHHFWAAIGLLFVFISFTSSGNAQSSYPQDFFRNPLDIPINLSGNFGELRTNHFHAGLDIKTNQQEGLNLYAAGDGYVSRVKVSPVGYGYALYICHPNGYTTVYGHMQRYSPQIDAWVKEQQYKLKSFSVDLAPDSALFPLKKGDFIGWSGNSGGSGGPHLHFEIRETVSEKIVNPLLFGLKVNDKIPPSVAGIWIVPLDDSTWVNGARLPVNLVTKTGSGNCSLKTPKAPTVYGQVGLAIHTTDALDGNANRCGIYRIELFVDSIQVYGQRMDRLDFATNRAMNAHTIYERFKQHKSSIHSSYRLPGNPLDIYENLVDDGVLRLTDGKLHHCEYRVWDFMGNKSTLKFNLQAMSAGGKSMPSASALAHWNWEEDNRFENDEVKINMKAFTLYEDLDLTISKSKTIQNAIGSTFLVASNYEPVHQAYSLCLKADQVKPELMSKALIARYDPDKGRIQAELTHQENGWLCANPMYLGYFAVMIDTVRPSIASSDFAVAMKGKSQFSFRISDGLSGVDQIIPSIDGNWVLMEYDAKTSRLTYYFDEKRMTRGKHEFRLEVIDAVGNSRVYTSPFTW